MEFFHGLGKELCLQSLDMASVVVTNPQKTLQVLYERDGNEFLCILKQYGAKTNSEEAIRLSPKEYVDNFRKCVKEKWVFQFFKETKASSALTPTWGHLTRGVLVIMCSVGTKEEECNDNFTLFYFDSQLGEILQSHVDKRD